MDEKTFSSIAFGLNFVMIFGVIMWIICIMLAISGRPAPEEYYLLVLCVWVCIGTFVLMSVLDRKEVLFHKKSFFFGFDVKENGECVWRSPNKFIIGVIIDFVLIVGLFL